MIGINRKLVRRTAGRIHSQGRLRSIVLEVSPGGDGHPGPGFVGFRLQGMRTTYYLPVDWCFREACKAEMVRRRIERRKAKKCAS